MEIDSEKLASAKGIILILGKKMASDIQGRSRRVAAAWKEAGVASTPEDLVSSLAIADNELQKTRELLPSEAFADIALVRMRLALQSLSEIGEFAPADIDSCAAKAADYIYSTARAEVAATGKMLEEMREDCPIVILSLYNGEVGEAVRRLGLDKGVHTVIDSDSESLKEAIEAALNALGTTAAESVILSRDSRPYDLVASKSGISNFTLPKSSADEYLQGLTQLVNILEELES